MSMDENKEKELYKLAKENNRLIKKVYKHMVWGRVIKILYWVIIVGGALGAYWFLQPYFEKFFGVYEGATTQVETIRDFISNVGGGSSGVEAP